MRQNDTTGAPHALRAEARERLRVAALVERRERQHLRRGDDALATATVDAHLEHRRSMLARTGRTTSGSDPRPSVETTRPQACGRVQPSGRRAPGGDHDRDHPPGTGEHGPADEPRRGLRRPLDERAPPADDRLHRGRAGVHRRLRAARRPRVPRRERELGERPRARHSRDRRRWRHAGVRRLRADRPHRRAPSR